MNLALCDGAALGAERLDKAGLAEAPASVEVRPPSTTSPTKRLLDRKTDQHTEETAVQKSNQDPNRLRQPNVPSFSVGWGGYLGSLGEHF